MVLNGERKANFPREYDRWEADGATWIIQDLPPEDDEKLIDILVKHLCTDEVLCSSTNLAEKPDSVKGITDFWRVCIAQRATLACYRQVDGVRTLAGANCCVVGKRHEEPPIAIQGEEWQTVYEGLEYLEHKADPFEYLGENELLIGFGLVVVREFRGAKLGARILNAREPLCEQLGLSATSTVFTGISSQKLAARCGFTTIAEATLSEMAASGLKYPKDDQRVVKLMVKRFK